MALLTDLGACGALRACRDGNELPTDAVASFHFTGTPYYKKKRLICRPERRTGVDKDVRPRLVAIAFMIVTL